MKTTSAILLTITVGLLLSVWCAASGQGRSSKDDNPEEVDLTAKIRRFAPTEITANVKQLSRNDRVALQKLIEAAKLLDPLFQEQVWSGNAALKLNLEASSSAVGLLRLHYFNINAGPWSSLD